MEGRKRREGKGGIKGFLPLKEREGKERGGG